MYCRQAQFVTGHMAWVGGWVVFVICVVTQSALYVVQSGTQSSLLTFISVARSVTPGSAAGTTNRSSLDASDGAAFGQEPRQAAAVADQRAVPSHDAVSSLDSHKTCDVNQSIEVCVY